MFTDRSTISTLAALIVAEYLGHGDITTVSAVIGLLSGAIILLTLRKLNESL